MNESKVEKILAVPEILKMLNEHFSGRPGLEGLYQTPVVIEIKGPVDLERQPTVEILKIRLADLENRRLICPVGSSYRITEVGESVAQNLVERLKRHYHLHEASGGYHRYVLSITQSRWDQLAEVVGHGGLDTLDDKERERLLNTLGARAKVLERKLNAHRLTVDLLTLWPLSEEDISWM